MFEGAQYRGAAFSLCAATEICWIMWDLASGSPDKQISCLPTLDKLYLDFILMFIVQETYFFLSCGQYQALAEFCCPYTYYWSDQGMCMLLYNCMSTCTQMLNYYIHLQRRLHWWHHFCPHSALWSLLSFSSSILTCTDLNEPAVKLCLVLLDQVLLYTRYHSVA